VTHARASDSEPNAWCRFALAKDVQKAVGAAVS